MRTTIPMRITKMMMCFTLCSVFFTLSSAFSNPRIAIRRLSKLRLHDHSEPIENLQEAECIPIFDFAKNDTLNNFERIDDVIMGGISSSSLRQQPGEAYISWCGICRVDGGGFCGTRTLPFQEPLSVGNADGLYIECRLASDNDTDRRVWKMSTRTEKSRGEELYQSEFKIKPGNEWNRLPLPFSNFNKVRGARLVFGAERIDPSEGLYQIGLTMSKFLMAENMTEIPSFRPGYFELQVKSMGLYSSNAQNVTVSSPTILSPEEIKQNRPIIAKIVFPVIKLLFSEKARRRRSAMKILRDSKGMSRPKAILFGIKVRSSKSGMILSVMQAMAIVFTDTVRAILGKMFSYAIVKPLFLVIKLSRKIKNQK